MTECPRCGKPNPAEIHTCTPVAVLVRAAYEKGFADGSHVVERWIKCCDRMPEKDLILFVSCENKTEIEFAYFKIKNKSFFRAYTDHNISEFVTHWHPLPEPPKDI